MKAGARLADELRRIGRREGLDSVGICDARPFSAERTILEERKASGWSAGMQFTYRNPGRSTEPGRSLPGARALFVGARRYDRAATPPPDEDRGPRARVARYSWVDHYQPVRHALGAVSERLVEEGWKARVLVDDNALVDRAAAVRAGLGWYGKNTNVLLPGAGSWFVLGSVVTDAPLAGIRPVPVEDGCGACHRCIDDCPTGAITGPGELDARRCLAWLVQSKGVFPVEFRRALGDRIYGCDECQEVCPVNQRAARRHPPLPPDVGAQETLDVVDLLESRDEELVAMVGRWYIPGRELRYVRRNALVVLGNTASPDNARAVTALQRALAHLDPIIRAHAVWAAAAIGRRDLLTIVAGDTDPLVRAELDLDAGMAP